MSANATNPTIGLFFDSLFLYLFLILVDKMSDLDRLIPDDDQAEQYQLFGLENEAAADGVEFLPNEEVSQQF